MNSIVVTLAPEREKTRVLMTGGERDLLRAVLPSPHLAHPRAAQTLLEGLALWHQAQLSVVLLADEVDRSSAAMSLCDALGYGERTLYYEVAMAVRPERRRKRRQVEGVTSFHDLRRDRLEVLR